MSDYKEAKEAREAEQGYNESTQRELRLRDWYSNRDNPKKDKEFQRLIWRLQAKKYWATKSPEAKEAIYEYRRQWAKDNPERVKASQQRTRKKHGRKKERDARRQRRKEESRKRREAIVYTCTVCKVQWCIIGRIPCRPPKYCSQPCRSRAGYLRAKAAGKR